MIGYVASYVTSREQIVCNETIMLPVAARMPIQVRVK